MRWGEELGHCPVGVEERRVFLQLASWGGPLYNPDLGSSDMDHDDIVDRIYQVALEPSTLEEFMNLWQQFESANAQDAAKTSALRLEKHIDRALTIMHQHGDAPSLLDVELARFANLAAFCVDQSYVVQAANTGAQQIYQLAIGDHLRAIKLPAELRDVLFRAVQEVLLPDGQEQLLRADLPEKSGSLLLRVTRLLPAGTKGPVALVAGNSYSWQSTANALLKGFYNLTEAEAQVVRLMLDGQDTQSVARNRGTTEGTIRSQTKSIMSKMNVGSRTEIVRLSMALQALGGGSSEILASDALVPVQRSNTWLENEVWKPLKSLQLPDGRCLTYHDMGPKHGRPVLMSHMGSCMARWPAPMVERAFAEDLRVICPIRAGYGHSDPIPLGQNPVRTGTDDAVWLLDRLGIGRVLFVVLGTDFPFAVDLATRYPHRLRKIIGVGARPALPSGRSTDGPGLWQRFFFSSARRAPYMVRFASRALMAMCKRIGPEAMLRQLCKDSAADLALLQDEQVREVLVANIALMAGRSTNSAAALAEEFIAFQEGWGEKALAMPKVPVQLFLAGEDPTLDFSRLPDLRAAFPEMSFEVLPKAGLALMFQHHELLIQHISEAAYQAARTA